MAIPRVFISSTCYDLKHIRESLKYFVKTIGYEPVLSDEGDVFYSPDSHTHESCLKEVETCQIFILIIGGRYGGKYLKKQTSITNNEYKTAVENNIPIFALVEQSVYSEHFVFSTNKKQPDSIANKIHYPSVDNVLIFEFIDEVRKQIKNNAIYAFKDFSDIESYLRKQWAGMMYDFIANRANNDRTMLTNKLLGDLTLATKKTEDLLKLIARQSSGDPGSQVEEQINKIERIASLVKNIQNINDPMIFGNEISMLSKQEFLEKISNSNDVREFINSLDKFRTHQERSSKSELLIRRTIGDGQFRKYSLDSSFIDTLEKSFQQLKKADDEEITMAFNELYEI